MKRFKDFKEDLYKCSRCGLCQSVCPVYKATLNECAVSKGKFNMLNGILNGDLAINKNIKKYLDLCTGCNACKDFCPSGIDARKIFLAAKAEYYSKCEISLLEKIFSSQILFKMVMFSALILGNLYRFLKLHLILRLFKTKIVNMGLLGKRILLGDFLFNKKFFTNSNLSLKSTNVSSKNIIFFEGCINTYINDESKISVCYLLKNLGYNLIFKKFGCCGVSFLNDGNIKRFKSVLKDNLACLDTEYDFIVTDCASCHDVLRQYADFSDEDDRETALKFSSKVLTPFNLLNSVKFGLRYNKTLKVALHIPCHEQNDIESFVKNIAGIEYVAVKDYDKCCGFAGSFALKNQEISREISKQKALNYIDSGVDVVLTTCPACLLGLEQGFLETEQEKRPQAMSLYLFLAKNCKIL